MIIHPKTDGWRDRLDDWVAESHATPFAWGVHDCALNAATAVERQTGFDFAAEFRGNYDSYESGLALLQARGFESHADYAASLLPEVPPAEAQIGDIAAVDFGGLGVTLMVVAGHRLIGPMPHAAGSLPLLRASRAFAVGRDPSPAFPVPASGPHRLLPDSPFPVPASGPHRLLPDSPFPVPASGPHRLLPDA